MLKYSFRGLGDEAEFVPQFFMPNREWRERPIEDRNHVAEFETLSDYHDPWN